MCTVHPYSHKAGDTGADTGKQQVRWLVHVEWSFLIICIFFFRCLGLMVISCVEIPDQLLHIHFHIHDDLGIDSPTH